MPLFSSYILSLLFLFPRCQAVLLIKSFVCRRLEVETVFTSFHTFCGAVTFICAGTSLRIRLLLSVHSFESPLDVKPRIHLTPRLLNHHP